MALETKQNKTINTMAAKLKRTKQILESREDNYRELVENVNCIIMRIDTKGRITYFNEYAQKIFDYSLEEVIGKNVVGSIIPKVDPSGKPFSEVVKLMRLHPENYLTYENITSSKNGQLFWISWANKAIWDQQGNVKEILCVGHDITQRKYMENQLELLATAVRNSNDAIIVLDLHSKIISWNHGAERIYGYNQINAIGMDIKRIIPEYKHDEMRSLIKRVVHGETIEFLETRRLTSTNKTLDISLTATLIKDEHGLPFAITTTERDMAERRRMKKEILDITEREREQLSQDIHDGLGQILTGIAVKCKGLALKIKSHAPSEIKDALIITRLANEAIAHTRDLVRLLYPIDIQTGGLVSALNTLAVDTQKAMGVMCKFSCSKDVSFNDMAEAKQIFRIAQEATTNAVRHGKAAHINILLRITKTHTILSVKNDGLDFPILDSKQKGFGLKIMEYRSDLIGGTLNIDKGKNGGTLVTCIIPRERQVN